VTAVATIKVWKLMVSCSGFQERSLWCAITLGGIAGVLGSLNAELLAGRCKCSSAPLLLAFYAVKQRGCSPLIVDSKARTNRCSGHGRSFDRHDHRHAL
jgi:hypothetical protein